MTVYPRFKTLILTVKLLTVCLGFLVVFFLGGCGFGDERSIKHFESIKWGSDRQKIFKEYGNVFNDTKARIKPIFGDGLGGVVLTYRNRRVLNHRTAVSFVLHPDQGLVRGIYKFNLRNSKRDCRTVYRTIKEKLQARLEGFRVFERKQSDDDLSFCKGILIGKARWVTVWEGPMKDYTVTMHMGDLKTQSGRSIVVLFDTPMFKVWKSRVNRKRRN